MRHSHWTHQIWICPKQAGPKALRHPPGRNSLGAPTWRRPPKRRHHAHHLEPPLQIRGETNLTRQKTSRRHAASHPSCRTSSPQSPETQIRPPTAPAQEQDLEAQIHPIGTRRRRRVVGMEAHGHGRGPTTLVGASGAVQQTTLVGDGGEPLSEHSKLRRRGDDLPRHPARTAPRGITPPWTDHHHRSPFKSALTCTATGSNGRAREFEGWKEEMGGEASPPPRAIRQPPAAAARGRARREE